MGTPGWSCVLLFRYQPGTPRPTIYKCLLQWDDEPNRFFLKMVGNHQISIYKWLFGVPGIPFFLRLAGHQSAVFYGFMK